MDKQVLSDEEIQKIMDYKKGNKNVPKKMDALYDLLCNDLGLYEPKLYFKDLLHRKNQLTETEKIRAELIEDVFFTQGNVKYNPEELICPECGCRYIAFCQFYDYMKNDDSGETKTSGEENYRLVSISNIWQTEYEQCLGCGNNFNITKIGEGHESFISDYKIRYIDKVKRWISVSYYKWDIDDSNNFINFLSCIEEDKKWKIDWNMIDFEDIRYSFLEDPLGLIYRWDSILGIVVEYPTNISGDDVKTNLEKMFARINKKYKTVGEKNVIK